jgi:hypothetical protein
LSFLRILGLGADTGNTSLHLLVELHRPPKLAEPEPLKAQKKPPASACLAGGEMRS